MKTKNNKFKFTCNDFTRAELAHLGTVKAKNNITYGHNSIVYSDNGVLFTLSINRETGWYEVFYKGAKHVFSTLKSLNYYLNNYVELRTQTITLCECGSTDFYVTTSDGWKASIDPEDGSLQCFHRDNMISEIACKNCGKIISEERFSDINFN